MRYGDFNARTRHDCSRRPAFVHVLLFALARLDSNRFRLPTAVLMSAALINFDDIPRAGRCGFIAR